jgi:hypothetical protein
VAYSLEVLLEIELHFHSHSVFEKVLFLLDQLRRELAEALFCKLAVSRAPKIHLWIEYLVPALLASSPGFVLEELDRITALGALGVKDGVKLPEAWVLSWAFHFSASLSA